jgi:large subunit ribosomal protein L32e
MWEGSIMKKFLRRDAVRFAKFSKGRGKKAKWRSPKGRDNKMREKRKGYPAVVSIGYSKTKSERGKVGELIPVIVRNVSELEGVGKENVIVIGKIGNKRKIEILEKAKQMKLKVDKTNVEKALGKLSEKQKKKQEVKKAEKEAKKKKEMKKDKAKDKGEKKENETAK